MTTSLYTVTQVAERYQVSRATVLSWIHSYALSAVDASPAGSTRKFYRISQEALIEFQSLKSSRPLAEIVQPPKNFQEYIK